MTKVLFGLLCLFLFLPSTVVAQSDEAIARRIQFLDAELRLDADQEEEFTVLLEELVQHRSDRREAAAGGSRRGRSSTGSGGSGSADIEARVSEITASAEAILHAEQVGTYQELMERERGWWLDPQLMDMDGRLELSLEQCRQIQPILRRTRLRLRSLQEQAQSSGDRASMEKLREEMQEANENLLEFLDERQQAVWSDHIEAQKKEMEEMRAQRDQEGRGGQRGRGGGGKGGRGSGGRY